MRYNQILLIITLLIQPIILSGCLDMDNSHVEEYQTQQSEIEDNYSKYRSKRLEELEKIPPIDIVVVGDSHVERLPFDGGGNYGVGGDTIAGVLSRVDGILKKKPRLVFLEVGTNDITSGKLLENMADYSEIIKRVTAVSKPIVLAVPNSSNDLPRVEASKIFNSELKLLCEKNNVRFIDINSILVDNDYSDIVHLNNNGYCKVVELMIKET